MRRPKSSLELMAVVEERNKNRHPPRIAKTTQITGVVPLPQKRRQGLIRIIFQVHRYLYRAQCCRQSSYSFVTLRCISGFLHIYLRIWFPRQTCVLTDSCFWPTIVDLILTSAVNSHCTILHQYHTKDDWMAYAENHREYLAEEDWASCWNRNCWTILLSEYVAHPCFLPGISCFKIILIEESNLVSEPYLWLKLHCWSCT